MPSSSYQMFLDISMKLTHHTISYEIGHLVACQAQSQESLLSYYHYRRLFHSLIYCSQKHQTILCLRFLVSLIHLQNIHALNLRTLELLPHILHLDLTNNTELCRTHLSEFYPNHDQLKIIEYYNHLHL